MGKIQYTFDPTDRGDINDLFVLLNKLDPKIPADPGSYTTQGNVNVAEYERKIKEQDELLKRYEKQTSQDAAVNEDLRKKFEEADGCLKLAQEEINQKNSQIDTLSREKVDIEVKLTQDSKDEINKVKAEKDEEINELNTQIKKLIEKLSGYEPMIGNGEGVDTKYFKIAGNNLEETGDWSAPFIGKVEVNGDALFQFNAEKGPHMKYSQDSTELEKFCDIVEKIDNANHISWVKWGTGKFTGDILKVSTKAQIKLTKE